MSFSYTSLLGLKPNTPALGAPDTSAPHSSHSGVSSWAAIQNMASPSGSASTLSTSSSTLLSTTRSLSRATMAWYCVSKYSRSLCQHTLKLGRMGWNLGGKGAKPRVVGKHPPRFTASWRVCSMRVGVMTSTSYLVRCESSMWHTARAAFTLKGSVLAKTAKAPFGRSSPGCRRDRTSSCSLSKDDSAPCLPCRSEAVSERSLSTSNCALRRALALTPDPPPTTGRPPCCCCCCCCINATSASRSILRSKSATYDAFPARSPPPPAKLAEEEEELCLPPWRGLLLLPG
mmetsp:Transcript_68552/g.137843  ORF Transcript_68552/g.137843 Transcript_68552/m.137843 type:complete len:288 (-) Transcript_68552:1003-1866(-)